MRRWTRRIPLGLLIAFLLGIVITQIILWTDYPRRLVINLVQQQLGLRVEAAGLSTGWFGHTTLTEVKLSLPLAQDSFFDVPRMDVSHTGLPWLLITRKFVLEKLELQKPTLVVRQNPAGRWNVQDVAELIARATAGAPEPGTKTNPPRLPKLKLTDGTVIVLAHGRPPLNISPLNATGYADGPLVYRYDAGVADQFKAVGQVAPGEDFKHEVDFGIRRAKAWVTPWWPNAPEGMEIDGQWEGAVANDHLTGRLVLRNIRAAEFSAQGRVAFSAGAGVTTFRPQELIVHTPWEPAKELKLTSGSIVVSGPSVTLERVSVAATGGSVQLDGQGNWDAKTAQLNAQWNDLALPGEIRHGGNLDVTLRTPFPDRPEIQMNLASHGRAPGGSWDGRISIAGSGRSWRDIDFVVQAPRVAWIDPKRSLHVENIAARIAMRDDALTLSEVTWNGADTLAASGVAKLKERTWAVRIDAQKTSRGDGRIPDFNEPFKFTLDARGDYDRTHLDELSLRVAGLEAILRGDYVRRVPKPVAVSLSITHEPSADSNEENPVVRGRFHAEAALIGTLFPIELGATGSIDARRFAVLDREIGTAKAHLDAIYKQGVLNFEATELKLLGGNWRVQGKWPVEDSLRADIAVEGMSLRKLGDLLNAEDVSGRLDGKWALDASRPRREGIGLSGGFEARDVAVKSFSADAITGETTIRDGLLRVDPIKARLREGQATATLEAPLANLRQPTITVNTQAWPVESEKAKLAAWGETKLILNLRDNSAAGPLKARILTATTQQALGEVNIAGELDGRKAKFETIRVEGFGGHADGSATIDADRPNESRANLTWSDLSGERIAAALPKLQGLEGMYSGTLELGPAESKRSLEPLRLKINLTPHEARFRTVEIGPAKVSAFMNLGSQFRVERIVLDRLPDEEEQEWNVLHLADGKVLLWARRGRHPGEQVQSQVIVEFDHLSLDPIVRAFKSDARPMPARISGRVMLFGDIRDRDLLFGQGHVEITDSDLARVKALELLYAAATLGSKGKVPIGVGSLDFTLQRSTLEIDNFRYFNRGVEARSSGLVIERVWDGQRAPINGYVVGSARPLADLKLPMMADVDKIFSVLQSNLTTVKIEGTLGDEKVKKVPFSEVGDAVRRLLVGDAKAETQKKKSGR